MRLLEIAVISVLLVQPSAYAIAAGPHEAAEVNITGDLRRVIEAYVRLSRTDQLLHTQKLDELLERMRKMEATTCLVDKWLSGAVSTGDLHRLGVSHVLQDRVDELERTIRQTEAALADVLGPHTNSRSLSVAIQELAVRIATNETSSSSIKNDIIPRLEKKVSAALKRNADLETVVALMDAVYRAEFDSLCDRVAELESEVYGRQRDGSVPGSTTVLKPSYPVPTYPASRYYPDAYITNISQLCSNAQTLEERAVYTARSGFKIHRTLVNTYRNCSGHIVMLIIAENIP